MRNISYVILLLFVALPVCALEIGAKFAVAIERNDVDAVKELLEEAPVDTWIEYGEHKITPLMKAAWEGDPEIVKVLLDAGAKVNAQASDTKETALLNAVTRGHVEVVRLLLAAKADVQLKNAFDFNAFTMAVSAGNTEIAEMLLASGAKIHDGAHTLTPLQFAVSAGSEDMVRFLVKKGADVNYGAKKGDMTALISAIYAAKPDMVQLLVELKADVNAKMKDGTTALKVAQKGDQEDIIKILKTAGAK